MNALLGVLAGNAVSAAALALGVAAAHHWLRPRPAVAHALWAVVLLRLVSPPIVPVEILPAAALPASVSAAGHTALANLDAGIANAWEPWRGVLSVSSAKGPSPLASAEPLDVPPMTSTSVHTLADPPATAKRTAERPKASWAPGARATRPSFDAASTPPRSAASDHVADPPGISAGATDANEARTFGATARALPAPNVAAPDRATPRSLATPSREATRSAAVRDPTTASTARAPRVRDIALVLVLFGAVAVLTLGAWRSRLFRQLLAGGRRAAPALQRRGERLAEQVGLARCPEIWVVPARVPPMLWFGRTRPRVLLPAELIGGLTPDETDALLVHELAHVRRHDHWMRLVELAATALFWWYPLAWWARAQLREVEERCCDEWVARILPRSGRAYAEGLLKTLAFLSDHDRPLPAAATGARPLRALEPRLKEILMSRPKPRLAAHVRTALFAVAVLGLAVFPTWAQRSTGPDETPEDEEVRQQAGPAAPEAPEPESAPEAPSAPAAARAPRLPGPPASGAPLPEPPPAAPRAPVAAGAHAPVAPAPPAIAPAPVVAPVPAPPVAPVPSVRVPGRSVRAVIRDDDAVRVVVAPPPIRVRVSGVAQEDTDVESEPPRRVRIFDDEDDDADEPEDPALAEARRQFDRQRLALERERVKLEERSRELEGHRLQFEAQRHQKAAQAELQHLTEHLATLRQGGHADAAARVQAQMEQTRKQMELERRRMALEADEVARVGKLQAEIDRQELAAEEAEVAGNETEAERLEAAVEKLEAELEELELSLDTQKEALEQELMSSELSSRRLEMELERANRGREMERLARDFQRRQAEQTREMAARRRELEARGLERQVRARERDAERAEADGREAEARALRQQAEALQQQAEVARRAVEAERQAAERASLEAELAEQLAELEASRAEGDPEEIAELEEEVGRLRRELDSSEAPPEE